MLLPSAALGPVWPRHPQGALGRRGLAELSPEFCVESLLDPGSRDAVGAGTPRGTGKSTCRKENLPGVEEV